MRLNYTLDLRNHPMNVMLAKGVQASINSDDPCFLGYTGVAMDWVYATGAWQLDLRDIKKLSLNGIKYSSVSQDIKDEHYKLFNERWTQWVNDIIEAKF